MNLIDLCGITPKSVVGENKVIRIQNMFNTMWPSDAIDLGQNWCR